MIGPTGVVGNLAGPWVARTSCAPVVVSFDVVALVRSIVVVAPWTDAIVVLEIDVVPLRTVLVECSIESM